MIVPLTPELLQSIKPQPRQRTPVGEYAQQLAAPNGTAFAALADGEVVAAAGLLEMWPGRWYAWALLGESAGQHMLALTRAIRAHLDAGEYRRVEMSVDASFGEAMRWAGMLGFDLETPEPMRGYTPSGGPAFLFSRVR